MGGGEGIRGIRQSEFRIIQEGGHSRPALEQEGERMFNIIVRGTAGMSIPGNGEGGEG